MCFPAAWKPTSILIQQEGEDPQAFDRQQRSSFCVSDNAVGRRGYPAALLSIPFRALLAGLLREGTADACTSRRPLSSRTGHDSDRYTGVAGILPAPRDASGPAASTSDARAPQQSPGKIRKGGASGTNRSLRPSSAGVQFFRRQRFRAHLGDRAGFTTCAAISCDAAASFSGECRTCAAMRGPDPFGPERSLGNSIRRFLRALTK